MIDHEQRLSDAISTRRCSRCGVSRWRRNLMLYCIDCVYCGERVTVEVLERDMGDDFEISDECRKAFDEIDAKYDSLCRRN
jgi:hypothetical protein